jgi:hypothetical protein
VTKRTLATLRKELRQWEKKGVDFGVANNGEIATIYSSNGLAHMDAVRAYIENHRSEMTSWLSFVQGRTAESAYRHLQFAQHQHYRWIAGEYCQPHPKGNTHDRAREVTTPKSP